MPGITWGVLDRSMWDLIAQAPKPGALLLRLVSVHAGIRATDIY